MRSKLIVALDFASEKAAADMVGKLKSEVGCFKVGLELFSSCGPAIVKTIKKSGRGIFLDLKLHDIPNTAAKASRAATRLGVYMFNVHALGGYEMMKAAGEAAQDEALKQKIERPKVLAVTVLTSMDRKALKRAGVNDNIKGQVLRLARLAKAAGLDGVVASPQEAKAIRRSLGRNFLIVTPGVRPAEAKAHDQKRTASAKEAIKAGADFIVVGRPITEAKNPLDAARKILEEIE